MWFAVTETKLGSTASLTNMVVEVQLIAVVSILVPWIRWTLIQFEYTSNKKILLALSFIPILFAVVLRAIMPSMPE